MNLLQIANTEEGRYLIGRLGQKPEKPIVYISKNSFIEDLGENNYRATFFSRNPIERIFAPIIEKLKIAQTYDWKMFRLIQENEREAFLHYAGLEKKASKYPQILLDTFNPVAGANSPVDGRVYRTTVGEAFSTLRNGAGNGAEPAGTSDSSPGFNEVGGSLYGTMVRSLFAFDTSSLPDATALISATFSVYIMSKHAGSNLGVGLYLGSLANTNNIVNADYQGNVSNTTKYSDVETGTSDMVTSAYYDQLLNATGLAAVNKTGITILQQRVSSDATGSPPAWTGNDHTVVPRWADDSTNIPKLVVIYSSTSIKTKNGLAIGSVKTVNELAIASVKSINGVN